MTSMDQQGVSEVIGFIFIFAIVVIAYITYQATAVPQQNSGAEFEHNQQVQAQFLEVQDTIIQTGTSGTPRTQAITLGANYPARTIGANLGSTGGVIGTIKPASLGDNNITLEEIVATNGETADYLDSTQNDLSFIDRDLSYVPVYSYYQNAPATTLTGTVVFNKYNDANQSAGTQLLINDDRITIIVLNGSLRVSKSGQGAATPIITRPLSVAERSIRVQNTTGNNITLTLPTTVASREAWLEAGLRDQSSVADVSTTGNKLTIELIQGTYSLRMMKVGVGEGGVTPPATYLTTTDSFAPRILENSTAEITVEARDRFNNPVNGVQVTGEIVTPDSSTQLDANGELVMANQTSGDTVQARTNTDGTSFVFQAPSDAQQNTGPTEIRVAFSIKTNSSAQQRVTETIRVVDDDGGSGPGPSQCSVGNKTNPNTLEFNKLEKFKINTGNDRWDIKQVQVQDADNDDDLDQLKFEITDSNGTVRATRSINLPGQQYQKNNLKIQPDDSDYDVLNGETYELTATVCDADGNSRTETKKNTA